ncbi:hypothetical protein PROFUN_05960, partial [Planoprotostelium fungivorum]
QFSFDTGVLKRYCSAEESDDPYTMHLWSQIDPIVPNVAYKPCLLATTPSQMQGCYDTTLWRRNINNKRN